MRKSLEAIKGDKLQNIRNNKIYLVGDVSESFLLVDVETQIAKLYTKANIRRWFRMYEEYVAPVEPVEPVQPVETQNNDKITRDVVTRVIELLGCTAAQKKEYLGAYKEGQRGAVCMIRFSRKGGLHIDMKPSVYEKLDTNYRAKIEVKYNTGIYDRSRGYFRISDVDDLEVLHKIIVAGTN